MARAHLLVVDDEPSILTTLQKALTLEGYGVDVAGGIKVAEEKLKKRTYDLCLFDVMLPDGDGVELLQRMRSGKADTPVIMMSGHATIDTAVRAANPGMDQPPTMTFEQIIQSIYMTTILQLGGTTQQGQQPKIDLMGARQSIDMLAILSEKTKGNLTPAEAQMMNNALFEVRMASSKSPRPSPAPPPTANHPHPEAPTPAAPASSDNAAIRSANCSRCLARHPVSDVSL